MEQQLLSVLREFARTLVTEFSIQGILDHLVVRIVDVLPISAAGVTLMAPGEGVTYVAASSDSARQFEALQSELGEAPGFTAFDVGEPLSIPDLREDDRFPDFARRALESGVVAVFSFPLYHGEERLGALDLYNTAPGTLDPAGMAAAQILADVAAAYVHNAQSRVDLLESAELARQSATRDEQAVIALRASEARKAAVLASALDAVITIDGHGTILEFNPAAERTFGYSQGEVLGQEMAALVIPPDMRDEHRQGLARHVATGAGGTLLGRRTEQSAMRADGSVFPAEVSISAVAGLGPQLFTAFVRDITQRRDDDAARLDLEGRLHQTERLESLGQLAGGVAHDFNNALMVILNRAMFIADAAIDDVTSANADEIVASARRAARLTEQLLMFARREPIQRVAVDLNEIVNETHGLLSRTLGEHVHLNVVLGPAVRSIWADPSQIEQVLVNLALNARDAMPGGGTLTISTELVEIEGPAPRADRLTPGAYVELSVSDTGEGMSAAVAEKAFDPFFTTKAQGDGSGLGLATVYGIVTDAGGRVDLRSALLVGTTITAYFPLFNDRPADALPMVELRSAVGTGETILVVEDQSSVRTVTVAMLRQNGYVVLEAADAREAVILASSEIVDLLLTDVVMPGMSGRELADLLRTRNLVTAVVFMSGYSGNAFADARGLARDAFLRKPFDRDGLLQVVDAALHPTRVSTIGEPV